MGSGVNSKITVIRNGFGGAVTATSPAEAGVDVALPERGPPSMTIAAWSHRPSDRQLARLR